MVNTQQVIFDFTPDAPLNNWVVVDDVVMGGRSSGNFQTNAEGHGVFSGRVSLENNGGFSSVRYRFPSQNVEGRNYAVLRVKGDGKRYQFRMKTNRFHRHSYIQYFQTDGSWQTFKLPLTDFYPTFRGMRLDMANYPGEELEEIAILIANKTAESFRLEIDFIGLD